MWRRQAGVLLFYSAGYAWDEFCSPQKNFIAYDAITSRILDVRVPKPNCMVSIDGLQHWTKEQ
jgi:hypothetical protein